MDAPFVIRTSVEPNAIPSRLEQPQLRAGSPRDVVEPVVRREAFLRRPRQAADEVASDLLCGTFCSVVGGLAR